MLNGKKVAILVEQDFADSELTESLRAMRTAGATVIVVGSASQRSYWGKRREANVMADAAADAVRAEDFDAVIIPGGFAPDEMRLHQPMVDFVRKAHDLGKIVAAISHGQQLLISADIVRGRRVTSWPSVAVDLKNAGAVWIDEPVVRDGNLITSCKPADLREFNMAIVEALQGQTSARV